MMDELVNVMSEILAELKEMNTKLDEIKGYGSYNSIADVYDKLTAVESAVNDVESGISSLETTVTLGDNY